MLIFQVGDYELYVIFMKIALNYDDKNILNIYPVNNLHLKLTIWKLTVWQWYE